MKKLEIDTINNMQALGIYKPEFNAAISIYAGLIEQYSVLEREFRKSKFTVLEKTGYSDNAKKSPIVATLENLRKDILSYSNALGLTPAGLKKISDEANRQKKQPVSKLEMALEAFGT